jgi:hypothetical protein
MGSYNTGKSVNLYDPVTGLTAGTLSAKGVEQISADLGTKFVTGPLSFSVDTVGPTDGNSVIVDVVPDGVNVPTFPGFHEHTSSTGYVNTGTAGVQGVLNTVVMFRRAGIYFYTWSQPIDLTQVSFVVAPAFSSAPSIIGTPTVGVASAYTLGTVTGGPTPAITQQWTRDGVDIGGATGATYTPISGDSAHALRVRQIATNASGSASSTSVPATVGASATVPGAPTGLTLGTATSTTQPLTWTAPASNGGSALTDYVIQSSPAGAGTWTTFADGISTTASTTVTGLTASTSYDYRVAAVNSVGQGAYGSTATGSTTSGVATQVIRETTLTGGSNAITETGDATAGWNYFGSNTGTRNNQVAYAPSKSLALNADGEFRAGIGAVHTNTQAPMIGFDTATGSYPAAGSYSMDCGGAGGVYRSFNAGTISATSAVVSVDNDIMSIVRAGSTLTFRKSSDGGSTWTTIDTITGASTAVARPVVSLEGACGAYNLRGVGMS